MTNALAQNYETTDKNSAIDVLMQSVSNSYDTKTQTQDESVSKFSNLMNNMEARTQKAQKEFSEKAKVTNTSSINKKAFKKREVDTQNVQDSTFARKDIKKDIKKSDEKAALTEEKTVANPIKEKPVSYDKKEVNITKETDHNVSQNSQVEKSNNSKELSDINNSSPVKTSPVFSEEKTTIVNEETKTAIKESLEQIENNIQELVENIPLINENNSTQIQDLKNKIEDLITNFENNQELSEIIASIETSLNNTDLNQQQGENILASLNEVEELFSNALQNVKESVTFSNIVSDLKEQTTKIINNVSNKLANTEVSTPKENITEISDDIKQTQDIINELENLLSKENKQENLVKLSEIKEILTSDLKDSSVLNEGEKTTEIEESLSKALKEIDSLLSNEADNIKELETKVNEKLSKILDKLKNTFTSSNDDSNNQEITFEDNIIETDFTKNSENNNEIKLQLDKLTAQDFKNIDTTDKKSMNEILNTLQTLEDSIQTKDVEVKNDIEKLIKQINENEITTDELTKAIDDIADDIKIQMQEDETTINLTSEKTIDITSEFKKFNNNQNFSQNQNSNQEKNNNFTQQNQKTETNEFLNADFDYNIEETTLKGSTSKTIDTKNVEQNLQKAIYTQELMEEMMVEVEVKTIPSQSGALSVADEVAKLAIGESNALNPITSAHGSVTYDSMGANAIIKNAASLMKSAQPQNTQTPSMEDILNQVSNKITQLKDNSGQKLTMVLRPNDLGRLSIELTHNQNGLMTQIMAQNDDVRAYIERNIDSLRQQLADSGVNVNSIQIKTAGQEGSTQYDGNQNLNREQQENLNQQNNKDNKNQQQNQNNNKNANEILSSMSNYDMQFNKDFSSILNKTLSYGLN